MARWTYNSSLSDIQHIISDEIMVHMSQRVVLQSVFSIDFEEYQILTSKLLCITQAEEYTHYCLAIIVSWVASCRFGREDAFFSKVCTAFKKTQQHHHSYLMEAITSTFYEYQIDTCGVSFHNLNDVRKVILYHGNINKYK